MRRHLIGLAALGGWVGLALQQYIIFYFRWVDGASLLPGLVNFFSFFTVLTNTLVAVVLTHAWVQRPTAESRFFLGPLVSSGIAVSIVVVSLAYSLLLRHMWQPAGVQFMADELLHDVMPLVFVVYWWCCVPKGSLRLKHIGLWVIYPLMYFAYALLRGYVWGLYQYPFIDVDKLGYPQVFINAGGILAGFVLVALAVVGLDKLARPPQV